MKNKKTILPFIIAPSVSVILTCVFSLISAIGHYRVCLLQYILNSDSEGIEIVGQTEQYGREGTLGKEIKCNVNFGYDFVSWNDGNSNTSRTDTFVLGNSPFYPISDYSVREIPVLSVNKKKNEMIYTFETNRDTYKVNFFDAKTFVAQKKTKKIDYAFESTNELTIGYNSKIKNSYFTLLSLFNDKTLLRQLVGIELSKLIFDNLIVDYCFVNLFIDNQYRGMYLLLNEKIDDDGMKFIINENNSASAIQDFQIHSRSSFVIKNYSKFKNHEIQQIIEDSISNKNVDKDSLLKTYSISQFLKNSAVYEDDFVYYVSKDNKISFVPHSFVFSAGLWKRHDCSPSGDVFKNFWFNNFLVDSDQIKVSDYIQKMVISFSEILNICLEKTSNIRESFEQNLKLWPHQIEFGNPDFMENYTLDDCYNYFYNFMDERIRWLQELYNLSTPH